MWDPHRLHLVATRDSFSEIETSIVAYHTPSSAKIKNVWKFLQALPMHGTGMTFTYKMLGIPLPFQR
jgi:hypothetical protein